MVSTIPLAKCDGIMRKCSYCIKICVKCEKCANVRTLVHVYKT